MMLSGSSVLLSMRITLNASPPRLTSKVRTWAKTRTYPSAGEQTDTQVVWQANLFYKCPDGGHAVAMGAVPWSMQTN
jgi:hypothetical protein